MYYNSISRIALTFFRENSTFYHNLQDIILQPIYINIEQNGLMIEGKTFQSFYWKRKYQFLYQFILSFVSACIK